MQIKDYGFVDCMFIDFSIDRLARNMEVIVEAYYPRLDNPNLRHKGPIKITINGIRNLSMDTSANFERDVLSPFSPEGDDGKTNEIYSVEIVPQDKSHRLILDSDYLKLDVVCESVNVAELD